MICLALVGGATWTHRVLSSSAPATPETVTVATGDIEDTVLANGTVEAFKLVSVGSRASGQIKSLKVDIGDTVKAGEVIAEIDSLTQQNDLRDAEASLRDVKAQLAAKQAILRQVQLAFKRQKQMLGQNATSRADYEDAEAALASTESEIAALEAQIAQAEISVDTATVNLGYTTITAPMDGTVVAVPVQEGQTVNAVQEAPTIIKLARLDIVTFEAEISEADVIRVEPGMKVYFTILGEPKRRRYATLRSIEPAPPSVTEDTSTSSTSSSSDSTSSAIYYNALFDVPNVDGKLRISMTAQVSVIVAEAKNALILPSAALGQAGDDGRYTVSVVGADGSVSPRTIQVGINNNVRAQVLDGLQAGDKVLQSPAPATTGNGASGMRGPPSPLGF